MGKPAAVFTIALTLGAIAIAPGAGAREPAKIKVCQTISEPGSYELANNLTGPSGVDCLVITANGVTIDLAGFTISADRTGIVARPSSGRLRGIAVRNGSISGFGGAGVDLRSADGSIVEGLRVYGGSALGIAASGVVKGNSVFEVGGGPGAGTGIFATGVVTGNYAAGNRLIGIDVGQGSTVIGNTANGNFIGIRVACPANLTDNTAVNNLLENLELGGEGCHNEDNLAP
jgi:hypothetical protein